MTYKPKKNKYLKTNYKSKTPRNTKRKSAVSTKKSAKKRTYRTQKVNYQQIQDFRNQLTKPNLFIGNKNEAINLRSSYEIRFCSYLDIVSKFGDWEVIGWDSEDTTFQYFFPFKLYRGTIVNSSKQWRTYYLDNVVKLRNVKNGKIKIWYCEVKPSNKLKEPINNGNPSYPAMILEYRKNLEKWKSVEEFCKKEREKGINAEFKIITEAFLARLKFEK